MLPYDMYNGCNCDGVSVHSRLVLTGPKVPTLSLYMIRTDTPLCPVAQPSILKLYHELFGRFLVSIMLVKLPRVSTIVLRLF